MEPSKGFGQKRRPKQVPECQKCITLDLRSEGKWLSFGMAYGTSSINALRATLPCRSNLVRNCLSWVGGILGDRLKRQDTNLIIRIALPIGRRFQAVLGTNFSLPSSSRNLFLVRNWFPTFSHEISLKKHEKTGFFYPVWFKPWTFFFATRIFFSKFGENENLKKSDIIKNTKNRSLICIPSFAENLKGFHWEIKKLQPIRLGGVESTLSTPL